MRSGLTDLVVVGEHRYLIQTEDLGAERKELWVSVFEEGVLVHRRHVSYADLVALALSDQDDMVATAMENLHNQVRTDLSEGLVLEPV